MSGKENSENLTKARKDHMARIRERRNRKLGDLDGPEASLAARVEKLQRQKAELETLIPTIRDKEMKPKVLAGLRETEAAHETAVGNLAAVRDRKQTLRDLPTTVDLDTARSEADVKAVWPAELG